MTLQQAAPGLHQQQLPAGLVARPAVAADHGVLAATLAAAFADDPALTWVLPLHVARREARLRRFFSMELLRGTALGGTWTAADGAGAALWCPPGQWRPSATDLVSEVPTAARVFGPHLPRALRTLHRMQRSHPTAPHWYLSYLGTAPQQQGRGVGSALLRPVLERCDRERLPAYLEASTERNRRLYERHGFVVTGTVRLPGGGPTLWRMWRTPGPGPGSEASGELVEPAGCSGPEG